MEFWQISPDVKKTVMVVLRTFSHLSFFIFYFCMYHTYCSVFNNLIFLLFLLSFSISHSQHPQGLPPDPSPGCSRRKWNHPFLQCHPGAHPSHLSVGHLVSEEGSNVRGNLGVRTSGLRDCGGKVCQTLRWWRHSIGSREEWSVWVGDFQGNFVRWRDLWVQWNRMDARKWREMDKNCGEHKRDGNGFCYSNR